MLAELARKDADIERIAAIALHDDSLLSELLEGLKLKVSPRSGQETVRYNCFKTLMAISRSRGDRLYPAWDSFASMLRSENSYHKMAVVQLIANLVGADVDNKFDGIFDEYYGLLDDESMIVAVYAASASGRIVKARPELESRVTKKLLAIPETHHPASRKALVLAGAIEAFSEYVTVATDKQSIVRFVGRQEGSESPKTRRLAKEFLRKWGTS